MRHPTHHLRLVSHVLKPKLTQGSVPSATIPRPHTFLLSVQIRKAGPSVGARDTSPRVTWHLALQGLRGPESSYRSRSKEGQWGRDPSFVRILPSRPFPILRIPGGRIVLTSVSEAPGSPDVPGPVQMGVPHREESPELDRNA